MRIVAKIGGAQLEHAEPRARLAGAVRRAVTAGHSVVLVHGGGNQIRAWTARLGLPDRYHAGLRITDGDTAEVVTAVLCGLVNKQLVTSLEAAGVRAVGLCGADSSSFSVQVHRPDGNDLGFVGTISAVNSTHLDSLLELGTVPVLASVAPLAAGQQGDRSRLYNVNADTAAAALAVALDADALLLLTDVAAVRDDGDTPLATITAEQVAQLTASGALGGGMLPKLSAAVEAATATPRMLVKIASAAGEDAIRDALVDEHGTRIRAGASHG